MLADDALVDAVSATVARQTGLRLDRTRWPAVRDAMQALDARLGDTNWGGEPWSPAQVEAVAEQIAVGETYFFRDPAVFEQLESTLLPALVQARREACTLRLRLWSAGCCTGEEAYSLAIVLCRVLPDIADWDIEILGTDIHPGFLAQAEAGVYIDWSFRGLAAPREAWFEQLDAERWAVRPELRRLVSFRHANLTASAPGTDFDLILCRHVLMYFEPHAAALAVERLRAALAPGGLLLLGATENDLVANADLQPERLGDVLIHRRPLPLLPPPPAQPLRSEAQTREAQLVRALARCEAALADDRCDAALHFLHAQLLEQLGRVPAACDALRRSLFLDAHFAPAHEALGRLHERQGHHGQASRHFRHALRVAAEPEA